MGPTTLTRTTVAALATMLLIPAVSFGQANSGIAGVARDASGGVLPGVSVEASSPALLEGSRSVVTDNQGRYNIIEMRPGVYTVTFSLSGFSTVRREGIELTSGFTATINADMAVGTLDETITVTGASPVVDTQNVGQRAIITNEVIDVLPTGRAATGLGQLIPGVLITDSGRRIQDVGGLAGEGQRMNIHGGRPDDMHWLINGLPFNNISSTSQSSIRPDVGEVEEFALGLGANAAEYRLGGIVMNLVPKEGGNRFAGMVTGSFANDKLQSNNSTPELEAQGLTFVNRLDHIWDAGFSLGGPIKQDKLWFFANLRNWGNDALVAGVFHDSNLNDVFYTPDLNRQAHDLVWQFNQGLRLTWQAAAKHKISGYVTHQPRGSFANAPALLGGRITTPEALTFQSLPRNIYYQVSWTSPLTSKILLEAGTSRYRNEVRRPTNDDIPLDAYAIVDTGLNIAYNAPAVRQSTLNKLNNYRAVISYVTGSHTFKAGYTWEYALERQSNNTAVDNPISLTFLNRVPTGITLNATPYTTFNAFDPVLGIFVQDQWSIKRLTANGGIRFDRHHGTVPAQSTPAVRFLQALEYPEIKNVPNWKNLSPRVGASYDLFGDGKTAIKASLSGYVVSEMVNLTKASNPRSAVSNSATRSWGDTNGNYIPECDFLNPVLNGECGPIGNRNFGLPVISTRYDPAVMEGWGVRPYNWETSVAVQHELLPGVAVNGGFFRRWYNTFRVTDNRAVGPADFDPYCITAPRDPRLPDGGGYQVCGLYDVSVAKFGQTDNYVTSEDNFGRTEEVYNGVDFTINARLPRGAFLQGGINTGRVRTNTCFVIDSPQALFNCEVKPPFETQIKLMGAYTLPWNTQLSASLQNVPGPEIQATYTARNADIAPTLGRPLSSGVNGTVAIPLIKPGTMYGDRMTQVDVRVSKGFQVRRVRVKANLDFFNVLNGSTVLVYNTGYGSTWLRPLGILPGRLVKFGGQLDF